MRVLFHVRETKKQARKDKKRLEEAGYLVEIQKIRDEYNVYGTYQKPDLSVAGFVSKAIEKGLGDTMDFGPRKENESLGEAADTKASSERTE